MRSAKEFCKKYECTVTELAGLMGVSVSSAGKWSSGESMPAYIQNHLELLDETFEILKSVEEEASALRHKLCSAKLEFYQNWRRLHF